MSSVRRGLLIPPLALPPVSLTLLPLRISAFRPRIGRKVTLLSERGELWGIGRTESVTMRRTEAQNTLAPSYEEEDR